MNGLRRDKVKAAISQEWEPAIDIAERAGVSIQSAVKILDALYRSNHVIRDSDAFVDEKFRRRHRWIYRIQVRIAHESCKTYAAWGGFVTRGE